MTQNLPKVFSGITPDQYTQLTERAQAAGIKMTGESGIASKYGVEMRWEYLSDSQQLTIECLRTPMFVSAESVYAKLQALVQQSNPKA